AAAGLGGPGRAEPRGGTGGDRAARGRRRCDRRPRPGRCRLDHGGPHAHGGATPRGAGWMNGATLQVEQVWSGAEWAEGPLWLASTGRVRLSDIPNNRILDIDPADGSMTVVDDAAEYPNGRTLDLDGTILQCSHGRRAVERVAGGVT